MSSIKITPLILFLLLLVVLVISVLFGNSYLLKEGFVSFQQAKKPLEYVSIPTYSKTATPTKLYDNLYYDNKNGNLIEVDSTTYSNTSDVAGTTIATTYVVPRTTSKNTLSFKTQLTGTTVVAQDTQPSLISTVALSYNSYNYPTQSKRTDTYEVFYFPWNDQTYIHVLDKTKGLHVSSFHFSPNTVGLQYVYPVNSSTIQMRINKYVAFADPNNNKYVIEPFYDPSKQLYQISKYVKYDITNGCLIVQTIDGTTKSVRVYNRNNSVSAPISALGNKNTVNTVSNSGFAPLIIEDLLGQNIILYLPYQTTTVVAMIGYSDSNKTSFTINNVCRFTPTTIDTGSIHTTQPTVHIDSSNPGKDNEMSEYYKWYWYWKANGKDSVNSSNDYLLKTQIVPPVCPACPNCTVGTCTNCKGNAVTDGLSIPTPGGFKGGSGGDNQKQTDNKQQETSQQQVNKDNSQNYNRNSVSGVITTGLNDVGYVAGKTLDTAGNVVTNVAHDVTGIIKGAGSGIKDILMQNQSHGRDNTTIHGPNGKPITINRTEGAFESPYGTTTGTQSGDQYSYYGALPSKGDSNYMPINADFSKFGR
jgi:hypothetical protein